MLRASALYLVIVIALVIALLCSFLVLAAYFYTTQYQSKARFDQLRTNLASGVNLLLATRDTVYKQGKTLDLFGNQTDSVFLKNIPWGIFDANVVEAYKTRDTVFSTFTTACDIDSGKWAAVYLIDEDRPLSVSGKTSIRGNAFLPKAGVRPAYVDNKGYEGDKRMVTGHIFDSQRSLPELNQKILQTLEQAFGDSSGAVRKITADTIKASFRNPAVRISLGKTSAELERICLQGQVILVSDTLVTIDSTASLNQVLVFAPAIRVKDGFRGSCQLFARDSISIGQNCSFIYPSCLGLLRFKEQKVGLPAQLSIGQGTLIEGTVFTYEKEKTPLPAVLTLGKKVRIRGQVYAQGRLQTADGVVIDGSAFTSRFIYQGGYTRYENYLINLTLNVEKLPHGYLTSELLPVAGKQKHILQWLEVR